MTHARCPLCGRLVALSSFDPSEYEKDIVVVEMTSLGRGRGFKVVREFSALGDQALMEVIAKRLRVLLNLIEGYKVSSSEAETQRLLDEIEELQDDNSTLRLELRKTRDVIEDLDEERLSTEDYERILQQINESLCNFEDIEDLDTAVETLVNEYLDILEELGDEG
jgi:septal ring factor EnvC (AmiA/AmiB activator)